MAYSAYRNAKSETGTQDEPEFFRHVRADGTPEGFVQLAVLHIVANQFYLFWHANYNDERIVYEPSQLAALLGKESLFKKPTAEERPKALSIDLQPVVEMHDGSVHVSFLTWTDWGGLYCKMFTFSKAFPPRLEKTEKEQVVSYFCGVVF